MLVTLRIFSSTSARLGKVAIQRSLVFLPTSHEPLANSPKLLSDLIVSSMTKSVRSPVQNFSVLQTQMKHLQTADKPKNTQFPAGTQRPRDVPEGPLKVLKSGTSRGPLGTLRRPTKN